MTVVELPRPGRPERSRLFPDQAEAAERLVRHLRRAGTRGLYVSATGTGKTLVSIRVADELGARLVLFVVPTLDLAAQTALAWRRDGHGEHMVIVSSMDTAGREDLVAARVMSTSDPHALGGLMSVVGEGHDQIPAVTVICTYDSLDKIEQTQSTGYAVPPFDLAVMDEAHRIAGRADKKWAAVNDAHRIVADRRLCMTANPAHLRRPRTGRVRRHHPPAPTAPRRPRGGRVRQLHGQRADLREESLRVPARPGRRRRPRRGLPHRGAHPHRHRPAQPSQPLRPRHRPR
ncbi:DEAD/DEAH box helicase family protein (plasmid) [Streptomyces sp. NBC_01450]|uniref:DEAD/DEAH box helicase family protein n=1 Tax=Streptomyces sp. NBC_01450 TaxID=2903871 RepID=UPI002E336D22|nr:DEAD/DEAH box helicase family protein [Streptomyces sp. NBC_01450]